MISPDILAITVTILCIVGLSLWLWGLVKRTFHWWRNH